MPVVVEVKSKADYDTWLGERKAEAAKLKELTSKEWTLEELVERGDKVYHTTCVACHQPKARACRRCSRRSRARRSPPGRRKAT